MFVCIFCYSRTRTCSGTSFNRNLKKGRCTQLPRLLRSREEIVKGSACDSEGYSSQIRLPSGLGNPASDHPSAMKRCESGVRKDGFFCLVWRDRLTGFERTTGILPGSLPAMTHGHWKNFKLQVLTQEFREAAVCRSGNRITSSLCIYCFPIEMRHSP
jgi:hypothetical protein